ncbi:MAG: phosphoglyceromutase [Acidimicrobiia bacterium]|nr:phosphoglyceromutase [Acidimicrobiia bacterium]
MTATLVLLRHGQSTWNEANLFTGWYDADLTAQGRDEAVAGGRALAGIGLAPDVVHTSIQTRAVRTANLALDELDRLWIPVHRSWRLNERHYGELTGKDKVETAERFGADQVKTWRRSYDVPPPPIEDDNPYHHRLDPRYAALPPDVLPASECLADVVERMLPYWYDGIVPDLAAGRTVLVAAHGNSLRALVKHLDGLTPDEVSELNLPTGVPIRYDLDEAFHPREDILVGERYLGDAEAARAAAEAVARQAG